MEGEFADRVPEVELKLQGYWEALCDFGIWSNGKRYIGCMETEINEAMTNKIKSL